MTDSTFWGDCKKLPLGLDVVEATVVVVVVVVVVCVVVDTSSTSHLLSPLMQSGHVASMDSQIWKRKHIETDSRKVNQRHPSVD